MGPNEGNTQTHVYFLEPAFDRGHVDRRTILDNLELVMLTIDELVDAGTILETDCQAIVSRVLMRGVSGSQVCERAPHANSTLMMSILGGGICVLIIRGTVRPYYCGASKNQVLTMQQCVSLGISAGAPG